MVTALNGFWSGRPYLAEIRKILEAQIDACPSMPPDLRASSLSFAGWCAGILGDLSAGFGRAAQALAAAQETGDPALIGLAHYCYGTLWEFSGNCEQSAYWHRKSVENLRQKSLPGWLPEALGELGDKLVACGDVSEAIVVLDESLEIQRLLHLENRDAIRLGQRGYAARVQGDTGMARRLFSESIAVARRYGDGRVALGAVLGFAAMAMDEGQPEQAARMIGGAEAAQESLGVGRIAHTLQVARLKQAARERLGEQEYIRLVAEGRFITYDQLVADALGALEPKPSTP